MKKQMKRWASSLATVILMATFVLSGTNKDLKNLIIPEADACSCSHVLNTAGVRTVNVASTVATLSATIFDENPPAGSNQGSFTYVFTGSGASSFVITGVIHTSGATVNIINNTTVVVTNIPPTGITQVFQIQGYFTSPGIKTLFLITDDGFLEVSNGIVDGGNCNSLSGGYNVIAANALPGFSAISPDPIPHAHGPHDVTIIIEDPESDPIDVVHGTGADFVSVTPTFGASPLTVTVTLLPKNNTTGSFTLFASDTVHVEESNQEYIYSNTNSPLSVSSTCESVLIGTVDGPKSLNALKSTDILLVDPTPFSIDYTLTDEDVLDPSADRTTSPAGPATTVPGVAVTLVPGNPLAVGVPHTFSYSLSQGATGTLIELFNNHETVSSSCRIGPAGSSLYDLFVIFGTDVEPPESGIRSCREVASDANSQPLNPISASEWRVWSEWTEWFGTSYGAAGNPPSDGPSPTDGLGDGFSYGDPETDIGLSRPL